MCGIFFCYKPKPGTNNREYFDKIQHRGPDSSVYLEREKYSVGFHRLAIQDVTEHGNQPFENDRWLIVCNGEIYNHKKIENGYTFFPRSRSDCEMLLHLFTYFSSAQSVNDVKNYSPAIYNSLDGEFALVAYDKINDIVIIMRDPYGVRPLFVGQDGDTWYFASEVKAIPPSAKVTPFPPNRIAVVGKESKFMSGITPDGIPCYYVSDEPKLPRPVVAKKPLDRVKLCSIFTRAVQNRLPSERPIGCFLSGGVDSSLVSAIAFYHNPSVQLFTIGLEGSVDVQAAKTVAEYIGCPLSQHHIVTFTIEEGFAALRDVIYACESYDITTIRASTPQFLLSKYITEKTDVRVLLSGEGSDELFAGYQYSKLAPNANALQEDTERLLQELYLFDNLRTDRTTAAHGLEVRVPFLDKQFTKYVRGIHPKYKLCKDRMEKYILRESFEYTGILPKEILWRTKEAFSDAVSSKEVSWYDSLRALIGKVVSDEEFENHNYTFNPPPTKEAYYYRKIFTELFGEDREGLIPYYWMPRWVEGASDPSARVLSCYSSDDLQSGQM